MNKTIKLDNMTIEYRLASRGFVEVLEVYSAVGRRMNVTEVGKMKLAARIEAGEGDLRYDQ